MDDYQYLLAVPEFNRATELDPNSPVAWDGLSWALGYITPADAIRAEGAARRALSLEPTMFAAYYHLGRSLVAQRRYSEAEEAFGRAHQLNPAPGTPYYGLAQLFTAKGEWDQAFKMLDKARFDMNDPSDLIQRTFILALQGKTEQAFLKLAEALKAGYQRLFRHSKQVLFFHLCVPMQGSTPCSIVIIRALVDCSRRGSAFDATRLLTFTGQLLTWHFHGLWRSCRTS